MSKLRGAFVGFGNIAEFGHWPAYARASAGEGADCEIVAAVDSTAARRDAASKIHPDWRVYGSLDELAAREQLDFVDICTPPASHAALARQALEKGLHVLCEKPLTLNPEEYQALKQAACSKDRALFTVHNWKFSPIFQKALTLIRDGRIGKVWHAEIFTQRNSHCKGTPSVHENWRTNASMAGGGILVDHGWHAFYLLLNLIRQEPQKLLAKLLVPKGANALEEAAQVLIQFPEADGFVHLTWRSPIRRNTLTVQGLQGTLLIDDDRILLTPKDGKQNEIRFDSALSAGSHHSDWFAPLLQDFIEEIRDPKKRNQNLRESGWCLALTHAAYSSARQGAKEWPVRLPGEAVSLST